MAGRFREATSFITRMVTGSITTLATWSVFRARNILNAIRDGANGMVKKITLPGSGTRPPHGIGRKKVGRGIVNTPAGLPIRLNPLLSAAFIAERRFRQSTVMPCIALPSADTDFARPAVTMTSRAFVSSAARSLIRSCLSTQSESPKPVAESAVASSTGGSVPVYNLTVEGAGCYYANGILVGNSQALNRLKLSLEEQEEEPEVVVPQGRRIKDFVAHREMFWGNKEEAGYP